MSCDVQGRPFSRFCDTRIEHLDGHRHLVVLGGFVGGLPELDPLPPTCGEHTIGHAPIGDLDDRRDGHELIVDPLVAPLSSRFVDMIFPRDEVFLGQVADRLVTEKLRESSEFVGECSAMSCGRPLVPLLGLEVRKAIEQFRALGFLSSL